MTAKINTGKCPECGFPLETLKADVLTLQNDGYSTDRVHCTNSKCKYF
jgi:hypothetical protein